MQKCRGTETGYNAGQKAAQVCAWDGSEILQAAVDGGWKHQNQTQPDGQCPEIRDQLVACGRAKNTGDQCEAAPADREAKVSDMWCGFRFFIAKRAFAPVFFEVTK